MKLVMTLLVRDEEDILESNLLFHLEQGVDHFIVTDNLSRDATAEILARYASQGLVTVINEHADDYSQSTWVTRMARSAAIDWKADWVINSDADEFWLATTGSLKGSLAGVPAHVGAVVVQRQNFAPMTGPDGCWLTDMVFRERCSMNAFGQPLPPKCAHRGFGDVRVAQGNHGISAPRVEIAPAPGLEILHFPVRTYEQFANKIGHGGRAYDRNDVLPVEVGATWRYYYQQLGQGRLTDLYNGLVRSVPEARALVADGELVVDSRVRDCLHGPPPAAPHPSVT